jgi:hypothetical protein
MKSVRIATLLALALMLSPALLAADFGFRAGRYNDADQEFVGAELLFDLGSVKLNPNLEYSLEEDVTAGSGNLDLTFDILSSARVRPYVGAGVGLSYLDDDFGGAETDLLGNLIGGVSFPLDLFTPYAQVKYIRVLDNDDEGADAEDDIALTVGLRF